MTKQLFQQACLQYLNLPYIWGGDDPIKGFDCSGLVQELLKMLGIAPPGDMSAQGIHDYFSTRCLTAEPADVGALIFYGKSIKEITHVSMMIDSFTIIEAGGGSSKTIDSDSAAKQNAYIRVRPADHRKDMVGILMPVDLPW